MPLNHNVLRHLKADDFDYGISDIQLRTRRSFPLEGRQRG